MFSSSVYKIVEVLRYLEQLHTDEMTRAAAARSVTGIGACALMQGLVQPQRVADAYQRNARSTAEVWEHLPAP
jgi:hypothetical protein